MNQQQAKSAFTPMKAKLDPVLAAKIPAPPIANSAAAPPAKITPVERLEKHLVDKFFYFVYAGGTQYRAGKIEAVVAENQIALRYFNMRSGKLEKWHHVVKIYDAARIDSLTGLWIYESEAELKADHGFLLDHIKSQEELLATAQDPDTPTESDRRAQ